MYKQNPETWREEERKRSIFIHEHQESEGKTYDERWQKEKQEIENIKHT